MSGFYDKFPQGLIYDWDNTLVDSWGVIAECLNHVRAHHGLETWTVEQARERSARALRVSFPEWFGDAWENARDMFYERYNAIHCQRVKALPGAAELLAFAKEMGLSQIVVSNKQNTLLRAEVEALGWGGYFSSVKGSMDAPRDKPAPEPVFLALHEAGIDRAIAPLWFIGDSYADVECALRSGTVPVLVHNPAESARLGLTRSFSDCQALKKELYNHSNKKNDNEPNH